MNKLKLTCIFTLVLLITSSTGFPGTTVEALRDGIIETARSYLGTGYHYGGLGKKGFDCSGFVHHVYLEHGIPIPRMSHNQYRKGRKVSLENARPADLVFFSIHGNRISHVGIYLGDNSFIHAPSSGKEVQVTSLDNSYWKNRFRGVASYIHQNGSESEKTH